MIKKKYLAIGVILILLSVFLAEQAKAEINITDPMTDDVFTKDFYVILFINDTDISNINIRFEGFEWVPLTINDQSGTKEWTKLLNISSYPNGNYILNAKYRNINGWVFTQTKVPVTIRKIVIRGNLSLHIEDSVGNAIPDVLMTPGDIRSDSGGNIKLKDLGLQVYNFSLTKTDYNTTYLPLTFTSDVLISRTVVMKKINELKEFMVSGYDNLEAGTTNVILITDQETGNRVDRAEVFLNDVKNKEYGPFISTNGRASIDLTSTQGGSYYIQVNKNGYSTWSEDISVWSARATPTPTPTPFPTPTPPPTPTPTKEPFPKQYYADAKMELTPDEYNNWQLTQNTQILVSSNVNGATIFIDGVNKGITSSVVAVSTTPGEHNIRISRTGYRDEIGTVTAIAGQQVTYNASLQSTQTNPLFYIAIFLIFGFVLYKSFGNKIRAMLGKNKERGVEGVRGDDAEVIREIHNVQEVDDDIQYMTLKCDRCGDWIKKIPSNTSASKIKEHIQQLDEHIEEFHREEIEVETKGKKKQDAKKRNTDREEEAL